MNIDAFQHELAQRGIPVRVEARDRLAVLVPRASAPTRITETTRRDLLFLASKHGFTHVAIELTDDWCSGASLYLDQSD